MAGVNRAQIQAMSKLPALSGPGLLACQPQETAGLRYPTDNGMFRSALGARRTSMWVRIVNEQMTRTKLGVASILLTLGTTAACSSSLSSAVVTGVATPCVGLVARDQYARVPVRVVLSKGGQTVSSQTVKGNDTYRFKVAPGLYVVSSDQSTVAPTRITLHTGQIAQVNLSAHCK
jgi:hypothetical protein